MPPNRGFGEMLHPSCLASCNWCNRCNFFPLTHINWIVVHHINCQYHCVNGVISDSLTFNFLSSFFSCNFLSCDGTFLCWLSISLLIFRWHLASLLFLLLALLFCFPWMPGCYTWLWAHYQDYKNILLCLVLGTVNIWTWNWLISS